MSLWKKNALYIYNFFFRKHDHKRLTDDLIKELIPTVGRRITFIKNLETYKSERTQVLSDSASTIEVFEFTSDSELQSVTEQEIIEEEDTTEEEKTTENILVFSNNKNKNLLELLNYSTEGKCILSMYKKQNELNLEMRRSLVEIIISDELRDNVDQR